MQETKLQELVKLIQLPEKEEEKKGGAEEATPSRACSASSLDATRDDTSPRLDAETVAGMFADVRDETEPEQADTDVDGEELGPEESSPEEAKPEKAKPKEAMTSGDFEKLDDVMFCGARCNGAHWCGRPSSCPQASHRWSGRSASCIAATAG